MKKLALAIAVVAALYLALGQSAAPHRSTSPAAPYSQPAPVSRGDEQRSATHVQDRSSQESGEGIVSKVLPDDNEGSRHQRFILTLPSGQTLLVAHNIDLAPRVDDLKRGDRVEFKGEYVPNAKGGIMHWTHRDPSGRHQAGWLKHAGRTYQ